MPVGPGSGRNVSLLAAGRSGVAVKRSGRSAD